MSFSRLRKQRLLFAIAALIALAGFVHLLEHFAFCEVSVDSCTLCHFVLVIGPAAALVIVRHLPVLIGRAPSHRSSPAPAVCLLPASPRAPPSA